MNERTDWRPEVSGGKRHYEPLTIGMSVEEQEAFERENGYFKEQIATLILRSGGKKYEASFIVDKDIKKTVSTAIEILLREVLGIV